MKCQNGAAPWCAAPFLLSVSSVRPALRETLSPVSGYAFRASSTLAPFVVPTSAGWSQLPRTLVRGCPVNLPHSPHDAIALQSHWLPPRTVLLSFDLPTHDPFQMDQIPVDLWVGHCSCLWIASAAERVNFVNTSTNY